MDVLDVIAEDEKAWATSSAPVHRGEWRGHPPTGRRFEAVDEIYVFRVEDGKLSGAIVVVEDNLTRLRQLGLLD